MQAIETIRCLEENIVKSIYEANIGSILGWGFPKKTGGILEFVNKYGLEKFLINLSILKKNTERDSRLLNILKR